MLLSLADVLHVPTIFSNLLSYLAVPGCDICDLEVSVWFIHHDYFGEMTWGPIFADPVWIGKALRGERLPGGISIQNCAPIAVVPFPSAVYVAALDRNPTGFSVSEASRNSGLFFVSTYEENKRWLPPGVPAPEAPILDGAFSLSREAPGDIFHSWLPLCSVTFRKSFSHICVAPKQLHMGTFYLGTDRSTAGERDFVLVLGMPGHAAAKVQKYAELTRHLRMDDLAAPNALI